MKQVKLLHEETGEGIFTSAFDKVKQITHKVVDVAHKVIHGIKTLSPKVENILKTIGDAHITGIRIGRTPVPSLITGIIKVFSDTPYDKLFHLFIVLSTNKGEVLLEKNEVINIYLNPHIKAAYVRLHHIPNNYTFTENKELSECIEIGYAARVEGRKNVEYMDGLGGYISTNSETFNKYYKKKYGYKFEKTKIYKFDYKYKERFYGLDWGISHSCFEYEPFGYGIFEAVDWGKLPILHEKWHVPLDYKYKAIDKETFKQTYETICEDDYETRKGEFEKLKNWMIKNFSNKDSWKEKLLDIYNGE